jgi:hypothetical protein
VAQDIGFNLFNSNLGTLTSVTLQLNMSGQANIIITNNTALPQLYTNASTYFPITVTGPPGSTTYISTPGLGGAISAVSGGGFVGPGVTLIPGTSENYTSGVVDVASGDWSSFEAPGDGPSPFDLVFLGGTFTSGISAPGGVTVGGGGSLGGTSVGVGSSATNTLTITYNYSATVPGMPEPGSWALFVAASVSASFAGIRRRRNRKAA